MSQRLLLIDSHPALFLLTNCFAIPKLMHLLRCSPCYQNGEALSDLDAAIRSCAESICNVKFDEFGWQQAILPVKHGGLGIRSVSDISTPAYLSSFSASQTLAGRILSKTNESNLDNEFIAAAAEWSRKGLTNPNNPGLTSAESDH